MVFVCGFLPNDTVFCFFDTHGTYTAWIPLQCQCFVCQRWVQLPFGGVETQEGKRISRRRPLSSNTYIHTYIPYHTRKNSRLCATRGTHRGEPTHPLPPKPAAHLAPPLATLPLCSHIITRKCSCLCATQGTHTWEHTHTRTPTIALPRRRLLPPSLS